MDATSRVLSEALDKLPDSGPEGRTRVALITFDSDLHFYPLNVASGEIEMIVVADADGTVPVGDAFLPAPPEDLLLRVADLKAILREGLLTRLPQIFEKTQRNSPALAPALHAATKLLSSTGGKIVTLLSTLPDGPAAQGGLKHRDDTAALGSSKESALLKPESTFYKVFTTEAQKLQVAVDLFLFPAQYIDVATLSKIINLNAQSVPVIPSLYFSFILFLVGNLTTYTGGKLFYYPGFNAAKPEDSMKFATEMTAFLAQDFCQEAVLRIRASAGTPSNPKP